VSEREREKPKETLFQSAIRLCFLYMVKIDHQAGIFALLVGRRCR